MGSVNAEDGFAISSLAARYSYAAGQGDADAIADCFTEDGVLAGLAAMLGKPDPDVAGRSALRDLFAEFLPGLVFVHQLTQMVRCEVSGDRASATFSITEHARWPGQDLSIFLGFYHDALVRTAEGWRFSRRSLQPRAVIAVKGDITAFPAA